MLCCKGCGSEAELFNKQGKILYPLCYQCLLEQSKLPVKTKALLKELLSKDNF